LLTGISAGKTIVNFVGHGNLTQWSKLPMLKAADASSLTDAGKPSMVFQWGCQTSDYAIPTLTNIDSALLTAADGSGNPTGAVLSVGSTGLDLAVPQETLAGGTSERGPGGTAYFYGYLAQGDSVGVALQLAKDDLLANHPGDQSYLDVVNSYTILGDPALAAYKMTAMSVPLQIGWNLIGPPLRPSAPPFYASDLAASINASLGANTVQLVAGYGAGAYHVYTPGSVSSDFTLAPGQGVFVQLQQGGNWEDTGYSYQQPLTYGLTAGWNLLALPYPASLTAGAVQRSVDAAARSSITQVVALFANGRYQTYVPGYSQDFAITAQQGVYVLSKSAIQWTP
jgi:hypothetical protein